MQDAGGEGRVASQDFGNQFGIATRIQQCGRYLRVHPRRSGQGFDASQCLAHDRRGQSPLHGDATLDGFHQRADIAGLGHQLLRDLQRTNRSVRLHMAR